MTSASGLVIEADAAKFRLESLTKRACPVPAGETRTDLDVLLDDAIHHARGVAGAIIEQARDVRVFRGARSVVVPESILVMSMAERAIVTCRAWRSDGRPEAMTVVPVGTTAALWIGADDPLSKQMLAAVAQIAAEIARALAPDVPRARLVIRYDGEEQIVMLGDRATIGRHADNTIVLADRVASRHHALIRRSTDRWLLSDAGSTSGIYVNGHRFSGERALANGDRFRLGQTEIEFVSTSGHAYAVAIEYREPTYAASTESAPRIYRGTFDVDACDEAEAREKALAEFRRIQRLSSVGWAREVVSVSVSKNRAAI